jgi:hypothetical protein
MDKPSKSLRPGPGDSRAANMPQVDLELSVIHATRTWIQYGVFGFAVFCIVIGAVEALFGR